MKISCKTLALATLATVGMTGVSHAQDAMMMPPKPGMMKPMMAPKLTAQLAVDFDKLFMLHAAQGNMFEVMSGQLALKKSRNAGVRMIAQTLIKEHGAAQRDLAMHFRALSLPMPTMPSPSQMASLEKLRRTPSGSAFDKVFMAGQVEAHENTIVLFQHEIDAGKNTTAKMHAMNKLPGIIGHTAMIYDVAAKVRAPGITLRPRAVREAAQDDAMNMKM